MGRPHRRRGPHRRSRRPSTADSPPTTPPTCPTSPGRSTTSASATASWADAPTPWPPPKKPSPCAANSPPTTPPTDPTSRHAEQPRHLLPRTGATPDALAPTEEALTLYRELATDNPAYRPDLASALNNLGICYRELGRRTDALAPTEEALTVYRELAADNPAYGPGLAAALNNLGICFGAVDRHTEALAPTEEAATRYRELAADNPAYRPNLAMTLSNLGGRYSALGRRTDALAPTEEALTLYRELATDNPAYRPNLLQVLVRLDRLLVAEGEPGGAEPHWAEVVANQPDPSCRAQLLMGRSFAAPAGDLRAVGWLIEATDAATGDRALLAAVHQTARTRRAADPGGWDAAWERVSSVPPPSWLVVDAVLVGLARDWIATPSYGAERDFLAAHPELLDASADTAVEEALLGVSEKAAQRFSSLRTIARASGIDAAYRALLVDELIAKFIEGSPERQRRMLTEHRDQLVGNGARSRVAAAAAQPGAEPKVAIADALITIAAHDATGEVVDSVFAAIEQPALFAEVLHTIASRPDTAATFLAPAARVALSVADSIETAGLAALYMAAAMAMTGKSDTAASMIRQLAETMPEHRSTWITLLARLGATQPAVLSLIPHLTEGASS